MTKLAKRLTPAQCAFLLGYQRGKVRSRAEQQEIERRLSELQDDFEAASARRAVTDPGDEGLN